MCPPLFCTAPWPVFSPPDSFDPHTQTMRRASPRAPARPGAHASPPSPTPPAIERGLQGCSRRPLIGIRFPRSRGYRRPVVVCAAAALGSPPASPRPLRNGVPPPARFLSGCPPRGPAARCVRMAPPAHQPRFHVVAPPTCVTRTEAFPFGGSRALKEGAPWAHDWCRGVAPGKGGAHTHARAARGAFHTHACTGCGARAALGRIGMPTRRDVAHACACHRRRGSPASERPGAASEWTRTADPRSRHPMWQRPKAARGADTFLLPVFGVRTANLLMAF
ncbi:MAG: hypothetical protein J3K34DRAFT_91270 [Monoraphidium minutum]|nr:MAG: hypothetical protein J3K34DRAFT_91270 [Monoraphidium minutum]